MLKYKLTLMLCAFFSFFFLYSISHAQNLLSNEKIEGYISTIPTLTGFISKQQTTEQSEDAPVSAVISQDEFSRTPVTDGLTFLKSQSFFDEFEKIINERGFDTPEDWAKTGDQIMTAFSAYHLKNGQSNGTPPVEDIQRDMQQQLSNIEKNKFISPEQKKILSDKLQKSIALLSDPNYIDSNNITVISPYIERLNSLFKEPQ